MSGPPPKPSALKKLANNPGQRPLNEHEPEPVQELFPKPPEHMQLGELATRIWNLLIPDLVPLGLVTRIDKSAIARYCTFFAQWIQVQEQLAALPSYTMPIYSERPRLNRETGCYYFDPATREILKEPYVVKMITVPQFGQQLKLSQEMRKLESEFGMTPAARTRISIQLKEPPNGGGTDRPRKKFTYRTRPRQ